jgi:hypothetical protein
MALLDSLPPRPLSDATVAKLNRADAIELAVPLSDSGPTDALLLATERWVKAVALAADGDASGWTVVETVRLDDGNVERYDALRACEDALRRVRGDGTGG